MTLTIPMWALVIAGTLAYLILAGLITGLAARFFEVELDQETGFGPPPFILGLFWPIVLVIIVGLGIPAALIFLVVGGIAKMVAGKHGNSI